jgi:hypothetical protein
MIANAKQSRAWSVVLVAGLVVGYMATGCSIAALAATAITGRVRNQTSGRFESGDEVILLRLQTGLYQASLNKNLLVETRTRTDSQGWFSLDVRYPDNPHLVRVIHEGVNYDRLYDHGVFAGDAVFINVFDAVSKVQGVTGNIEIIRIGTAGDHLHVSDMVEIENDSSPPLTQAGERAFEVHLPAHAQIDSVLAAGPGTAAVLISASPVPGEPGHYAVTFPLQPGATKFAFNYDLPYDGHAAFLPKNMYPLQQLAVMIPPTMKFVSRSSAFELLRTGNDRYQVEACERVTSGDGPAFEVSGVGALPALGTQGQSPRKSSVVDQPIPALSAPASSRAQAHRTTGLDIADALGKFARQSRVQWWLLGTIVVMLGGYGFLLGRRQHRSDNCMTKAGPETRQPGETTTTLLEALKIELRQLEVDHSLGTITREEYASAKQALEGTVSRALARTGSGGHGRCQPGFPEGQAG